MPPLWENSLFSSPSLCHPKRNLVWFLSCYRLAQRSVVLREHHYLFGEYYHHLPHQMCPNSIPLHQWQLVSHANDPSLKNHVFLCCQIYLEAHLSPPLHSQLFCLSVRSGQLFSLQTKKHFPPPPPLLLRH